MRSYVFNEIEHFQKVSIILKKALKVGLPREEYTNWFSNTKWSDLKTYIQVTVSRVSKLLFRQQLMKKRL